MPVPRGKGTKGVIKAVGLKDYHTSCGKDVGAQHQATEASKCVGLLGCLGRNSSH